MKKIYNMYIYDHDGQVSKLYDAIEKINFNGEIGLDYDWQTDSSVEFIKEVLKDNKLYFVEFQDSTFERVTKEDIEEFFTKKEIAEAQA